MSKTPLRSYLDGAGLSAEAFAVSYGLSAWSVRHWVRGDKEPSLDAQRRIEDATNGKVSPRHWLDWKLAKVTRSERDAA